MMRVPKKLKLCNGDVWWLLRGKNCIFIYYFDRPIASGYTWAVHLEFGICNGLRFLSEYSLTPCQYHSTNVTQSSSFLCCFYKEGQAGEGKEPSNKEMLFQNPKHWKEQ